MGSQARARFALGYAEFAVHDCELTPAMIYTVNFGLANLVRSHQTVFQRNVERDFRVRFESSVSMRITKSIR